MNYEVIPVTVGTPAWLELRKQGIGGSDCAAALGVSKYRTPYQVYCDKLGLAEPLEETEPMYWGKVHEKNIVARYAQDTNMDVECPQAIFRSKLNRFMQYTPDGIVGRGSRLLEVKTSRYGDGFGESGSDVIPQEYILQVQHGMAVLGLPVCDVAVLIAGSEYRQYEIWADKDLQGMIIEGEYEFWEKVQNRVEPELISPEDIKRRYQYSMTSSIEATEEIANEIEELKITKGLIKSHETDEARISSVIKSFMAENDTLTYAGKPLAAWKTTTPGQKFNLDAFKKDCPDIYKKYLVDAAPQRRFLIK